ncbi:MAG: B12-binding domain-containing radical SAM protein [bacterium]
MRSRVLLIDPPYDRLIGFKSEWFPLGLTSIASYLIKRGHDQIAIYHAEHDSLTSYKSIVHYSENMYKYKEAINSKEHPAWNEVKETINAFKPDIVGISVLSAKVPSAFRVAKICKDLNQDIKVVFGGHHPTISPEECLSNDNVDFAIRGEGEFTFNELIHAINNSATDLHAIPGLSFKSEGNIKHNEDRKAIENLDLLPIPDRSRILHANTYRPEQFSMIMTSRGCPYKCGFCGSQNMWGRKVRFRSIDSVIEEIKELRHKYSIKDFIIMDDTFTIKRKRVEEFCSALKKNRINIKWSCLSTVDLISDDIIVLMKQSGCTKLMLGIESGNQRILDFINKKITLDQIRNAVNILNRNKMYWTGAFMFGFPTETEKEMMDTLRFMKELKPNWANISIFTPYIGTDLYNICRKKKLINEHVDYSKYTHQSHYIPFSEKIPPERSEALAKYLLKEFHRYNSSYRLLLKRARIRNYQKNPGLLLHDLKKVITWLK